MKQSCLYEKLGHLNARFETAHDWSLPMNFESIEKEYEILRQKAGLLDFSHRGKIKVSGKDRAAFLHNMLSNDIKGLKTQEARYAVLLTPKGKIISDLFVYALSDHHFLECSSENTLKVIEKLNSFIITEDVQLEDVADQYALLSVQGPLAISGISKLKDISFFQNARLKTPGADVWISTAEAISVWEKISALENFKPAGFAAYDIVRIEDGIPEYGKELDENIIPNEANLQKAISYTKGCYPGQEIVARIKYLGGVQKILCGLTIEGNIIPGKGASISTSSGNVGTLTSACFSTVMHSVIGLGYLKTSANNPETALSIRWQEKNLIAQIRPIE